MKNQFFIIISLVFLCFFYSCTKDYSIEGGSVTTSGSWNFTSNGQLSNGNIDTAFLYLNTGTRVLHLTGPNLLGDRFFILDIYSRDVFKTGTYKVSSSEVNFTYSSISKTIYQSDKSAGEFIVTINEIDNNHVSGSFSGLVNDSTGTKQQIELGLFATTINLKNNQTTSVGVLGTTLGQCSPDSIGGSYTSNTPLSSGNVVQVQVNVTTPGTFLISTNNVNGISFSNSGTFTSKGPKNVILYGSGTPVAIGTNTYTVTYGPYTCNFNVETK